MSSAAGTSRVGFGTASKSTYELDKLFLDLVRLGEWGVERDGITAVLDERRAAWDQGLSGLGRRQLTDEQFEYYANNTQAQRRYVDPEQALRRPGADDEDARRPLRIGEDAEARLHLRQRL